MSYEINVVSRTQTIVVEPTSKSVSVVNEHGPPGPQGEPGPTGPMGPASYINERSVQSIGGSGGVPSANVWHSWPISTPLTMTFNKLLSSTHLIVNNHMTAFGTAVGVMVETGILVAGVGDFMLSRFFWNTVQHHTLSGVSWPISDVPAGPVLLTLRVKVLVPPTPVGPSMSIDANDFTSFTCREITLT